MTVSAAKARPQRRLQYSMEEDGSLDVDPIEGAHAVRRFRVVVLLAGCGRTQPLQGRVAGAPGAGLWLTPTICAGCQVRRQVWFLRATQSE